MSRRVVINLIAFLGVFFLMLWWAINNIINPTELPLIGGASIFDQPYEITGEFAATAGVSDNSEVAYLGVNYGEVSEVDIIDGRVMITMAIDAGKQIPARSKARVFRKSAVGEPYIDFQPPDDYEEGEAFFEEGATIPLEQTSVPLEFSELLRTASRVLGNVDPEQTRTLVHELAVALEGRSDSLRNMTVSSDALLATIAENADLLDSLSANSTRLTRTVTEKRGALSGAISDLADLGESLRRAEPDTNILLERGTELIGTAADLVDDVKGNLDCVVHDLDDVITLTSSDENLANTQQLIDTAPTAFDYVFMTRDYVPGGLWVRVHLVVNFSNPAQQYVPPTELPAVPQIPPCVSTLDSRDDVRVSATGSLGGVSRVSGTLPATGGRPLYAIAILLLAGAAAALLGRRSVDS